MRSLLALPPFELGRSHQSDDDNLMRSNYPRRQRVFHCPIHLRIDTFNYVLTVHLRVDMFNYVLTPFQFRIETFKYELTRSSCGAIHLADCGDDSSDDSPNQRPNAGVRWYRRRA